MKYQVQQISYDFRTFQDIKECTWTFDVNEIETDKGSLDILDFMEVEQNGQVGVQMNVDGWLDLDEYHPDNSLDGPVNVQTIAIMRQPHNVWLWVYMFDENNEPIAAFCGTDGLDETDSFAKYVKELKRMTDGGSVDDFDDDFFSDNEKEYSFSPVAEERVSGKILADGKKYNGWGCYHKGSFIPHGCGKKFYPDFYVYGNYNQGVLEGPAINSHDHYMYTMQFKGNRGNGWGLCINGDYLVEFGYYKESRLQTNLIDFVQWYYEGKMGKSGRSDENMMSMYVHKETHEVSTLLIGYAPKKISEELTLTCMGFRFTRDGSVWVGNGNLSDMTGNYMHFKPDGCIDIGSFQKGDLVNRSSLQDFIDSYFGTWKPSQDDPFASLFRAKSAHQSERISERELYRNVEEPRIEYSYFTNEYLSEDLPF